MTLPFVSALCPTYGRAVRQPHVIAECVYWYTQQTYPVDRRELLIVNDAPGQVLVCSVPGVRIINLVDRMSSLGAKCNVMLNWARGSISMLWEDDDIGLPDRMEQGVKAIVNGDYDYWNPRGQWYEEAGTLHKTHNQGVCHNCAIFKTEPMRNRYPGITQAHDASIDTWASTNLKCNKTMLTDPKTWTYVYRWGVSDYHLSGFHDMTTAYASAVSGGAGRYEILPIKGKDYVTATKEAAK